jgi:AAA domain, putative AbiEii toxin, Type IV TA system
MELIKFSCYLNKDSGYNNDWIIEDVNLNPLNLLVGKNSTGKSRALRVIKSFSNCIKNGIITHGHFIFHFKTSKNDNLIYEMKSDSLSLFYERITLNKDVLLSRNNISAQLYSYTEQLDQIVHPPKNRLTLHTRRDVNEYPFFEEIVAWAENLQYFNFGHLHTTTSVFDSETLDKESVLSSVLTVGEMLDRISIDSKANIIKNFNELGYDIENLFANEKRDKKEILIKEKYLNDPVSEVSISQGMYRAISLLVFIQYMIEIKSIKTIVIDDLCEGLDYDRASKLGKKVFEILEKNNIQVIATTNDYFLMNSIDIDYWNILKRKDNIITSYNKVSNPELFKKFDFSGLMNFDLFTSDFLAKELNNG